MRLFCVSDVGHLVGHVFASGVILGRGVGIPGCSLGPHPQVGERLAAEHVVMWIGRWVFPKGRTLFGSSARSAPESAWWSECVKFGLHRVKQLQGNPCIFADRDKRGYNPVNGFDHRPVSAIEYRPAVE